MEDWLLKWSAADITVSYHLWVHKMCTLFYCDLPQIENKYSSVCYLVEKSYPSPLFQSLDCEDFL
ncbi:hypothetical protein FJ881_13745 [Escherichia albertii]|nr:hypothetical protein [Escherichia albertii]QTA12640.1 hypothetical protein FYK20_17745 [Escherichia albertii]QTA27215.1 hypothetical protein FYK17_15605 [Escherichia albertii]